MPATAFSHLARQERPGLSRLLVAAAAEFREVDDVAVRVALDVMAAHLYKWTEEEEGCPPAEAIARLVVDRGLRSTDRVGPDDAMIDRVVDRRRGHPALLASICVDAACRAGLPVGLVTSGDFAVVGIRRQPSLEGGGVDLVDPTNRMAAPREPLRWRCSHEVAHLVLAELSRLYCLVGDVPRAMRAVELRAELPSDPTLAERIAFEVSALRAMMN